MAWRAVRALAIWSSISASLRRASRSQSPDATVRGAISAFCSASENPTSRRSRMTPTLPVADSR